MLLVFLTLLTYVSAGTLLGCYIPPSQPPATKIDSKSSPSSCQSTSVCTNAYAGQAIDKSGSPYCYCFDQNVFIGLKMAPDQQCVPCVDTKCGILGSSMEVARLKDVPLVSARSSAGSNVTDVPSLTQEVMTNG
ncbi:hypothetical protein HDU76_012266, partial [Blyttiomyces sp. JEL0837]